MDRAIAHFRKFSCNFFPDLSGCGCPCGFGGVGVGLDVDVGVDVGVGVGVGVGSGMYAQDIPNWNILCGLFTQIFKQNM